VGRVPIVYYALNSENSHQSMFQHRPMNFMIVFGTLIKYSDLQHKAVCQDKEIYDAILIAHYTQSILHTVTHFTPEDFQKQ
jgi:hypothetical protein